MEYLKRILNYSEKILMFDLTHTMSIVDPTVIGMETPKIDTRCSVEKEFILLIHMNP